MGTAIRQLHGKQPSGWVEPQGIQRTLLIQQLMSMLWDQQVSDLLHTPCEHNPESCAIYRHLLQQVQVAAERCIDRLERLHEGFPADLPAFRMNSKDMFPIRWAAAPGASINVLLTTYRRRRYQLLATASVIAAASCRSGSDWD